jgi:hypothetical protein
MNNMNPWIVQALVEYDRERVRHHMEQIHLEEVIQAGRLVEHASPLLLMRIVLNFVKWILVWVGKFTAIPRKSKSEYRASG